jgi:hypothetical protein
MAWASVARSPAIADPCRRPSARTTFGRMTAIDAGPVAELLHEAAETHHRVYRISDGDDPDWASWYADWLIDLSELPALLGRAPIRSELVYLLVLLDKEFTDQQPAEPWEQYYARRLAQHFAQ